MLPRAVMKVVLALMFFLSVQLANAVQHKNISSIKDPGVINKERIIYWLIKRGELSLIASHEEKDAAYRRFIDASSFDQKIPTSISRLQMRAKDNREQFQKQYSESSSFSKAPLAPKTVKVLSVLIDFIGLSNTNHTVPVDDDMYYPSYPITHYQNLQFSTTGFTGPAPSAQTINSVYQYFQAESGGTFYFTGNTFGWVTADNNAIYYGENVAPNNNDKAVPALVKEAVAKAVAAYSINLADYDLEDPYDHDKDGNINEGDDIIDHVMIYHSSIGEEAGGGLLLTNAIWSHRYYVDIQTQGYTIPGTGKKVFGYTVQPINAAPGLVAHEFGHVLGLPDEYDTGRSEAGDGEPIGYWSIMSGGSWAGSAIEGAEPTGFSPYAREFFQTAYGGNWMNQTVISLTDLAAAAQTVSLVEAIDHGASVNQIKVNLPTAAITLYPPYTGNFQYHSGKGDDLNNSLSFNVQLPTATAITLAMKAHWDIENDWDFVQVRVNDVAIAGNHTRANNPNTGPFPGYEDAGNYITHQSKLLGGAEGQAGWVNTTYNLSAYSGQAINIRFEYHTDSNTGEYGFVADDITITAGSSAVLSDGAENAAAVTLDGFARIGNSFDSKPQHYWIQLRSHNDNDKGLLAEAYSPGIVVWFGNQNYSDNKVEDHPGYGFLGVVDADQFLIGTSKSARQVRDAAFSIYNQTPSTGDNNLAFKSVFHDIDNYASPNKPQAGLKLPSNGFRMQVLSLAWDHKTATLQLGKTTVNLPAASFTVASNSNLSISLANTSTGGIGSLTHLWSFGVGTASSTQQTPSYTYDEAGTYTVSLTVTDARGNTNQFSNAVTVAVTPPTKKKKKSGLDWMVLLSMCILVGIRVGRRRRLQ